MMVLDETVVAAMRAHAEEGYPHEVCGLLVGRPDRDGRDRRIVEAARAGNLNMERAADRYDLDPGDFQRIDSAARNRGLEILGVYHSHPDHPSRPSETDRQRAVEIWQEWESWSYVILEVQAGRVASWRSWILRNTRFEEEEIHAVFGGGE